jgi:exopolyphosphatase/guanosine-5'-triphosphate,3'-diphosphate pyrophosphatase
LRNSGEPLYGALDLGTNNCRLLLARPDSGGFAVVDAFSRIVRLGEGVSRTGKLSDEAMRRTISAIRVCANKLTWWRVKHARLVATEACRMAANGKEFIDRIADETGLKLEIIDRECEAKLAVSGAAPLIDPSSNRVLVFDIGGGSTELMWLDTSRGNYELLNWTSIPAGVVTLSEWFGGRNVTPDDFSRMREHVRPLLQKFCNENRSLNGGPVEADHLLGTSGTITTICGIHLGLKRYDRSKVDGSWVASADIGAVNHRLLQMSFTERSASPCIGRERADLVLAGCAILEEIRAVWPTERVRVADRGLREGILAELMHRDETYGRPA